MTQNDLVGAGKWVLVPGTLCTGQVFAPLLDALGVAHSDRRFITPDAPDVRDYHARLRDEVTGGEVVCGFSLGALILAHNLGALKAARIVVLLASNPFPDPPENRANRERVRDRVLAGGARDWVVENWEAMSTSRHADLQGFVAAMAEETTHLIPAQTELAASRPGAQEELARTDLPLVFVTGAEDRMTPASRVQPIVENARLGHLSIVEGLGHFALIEDPNRVARAIRDGFGAVDADLTLPREKT